MPDEKCAIKASRLTHGNFWFPVRIATTRKRIARVKPRLFGSNEEDLPISTMASVDIETGIIWSEIRLGSRGGSNPILSQGRTTSDARCIFDLIESFQPEGATGTRGARRGLPSRQTTQGGATGPVLSTRHGTTREITNRLDDGGAR